MSGIRARASKIKITTPVRERIDNKKAKHKDDGSKAIHSLGKGAAIWGSRINRKDEDKFSNLRVLCYTVTSS